MPLAYPVLLMRRMRASKDLQASDAEIVVRLMSECSSCEACDYLNECGELWDTMSGVIPGVPPIHQRQTERVSDWIPQLTLLRRSCQHQE